VDGKRATSVPDPLLGIRDIAEWLGVPRDTVKTWRQRGVLPDPDDYVSGNPAWRRSTIVEAFKGTNREKLLGGEQ
jgi:uncharacterized protein YjcR